jgi:hypothetical protein
LTFTTSDDDERVKEGTARDAAELELDELALATTIAGVCSFSLGSVYGECPSALMAAISKV